MADIAVFNFVADTVDVNTGPVRAVEPVEVMNMTVANIIAGWCKCFTVATAEIDSTCPNTIYVTADYAMICASLAIKCGVKVHMRVQASQLT